jgi:hypothetical protein
MRLFLWTSSPVRNFDPVLDIELVADNTCEEEAFHVHAVDNIDYHMDIHHTVHRIDHSEPDPDSGMTACPASYHPQMILKAAEVVHMEKPHDHVEKGLADNHKDSVTARKLAGVLRVVAEHDME